MNSQNNNDFEYNIRNEFNPRYNRPIMTAEHKELLVKWIDGSASNEEIKRCQKMDLEMEMQIFGEKIIVDEVM